MSFIIFIKRFLSKRHPFILHGLAYTLWIICPTWRYKIVILAISKLRNVTDVFTICSGINVFVICSVNAHFSIDTRYNPRLLPQIFSTISIYETLGHPYYFSTIRIYSRMRPTLRVSIKICRSTWSYTFIYCFEYYFVISRIVPCRR